MRTAEQVIREIHSFTGHGDDSQKLRVTAALFDMTQAWPVCPVIHIAGTNGKGSVCAMLDSVLARAGYRTGLYTSPFLQKYNERIRLNGVPVPDEGLARYGNRILDAADELTRKEGRQLMPFEAGTALAFAAFRGEGAEVIISETGLGGRLDPTNVIPDPAVCGITAIGMDHTEWLGTTPEAIAAEKAGIIKPGVPVVVSPQEYPDIASVFTRIAAERGAPLTLLRAEQITNIRATARETEADFETADGARRHLRLSLPGRHQTRNALTALEVIGELRKQGFRIPEEAVSRGLAETVWPGRLEWHGRILMDGAHNAQGAAALRRFAEEQLSGTPAVLLTGVLREKLTEEMLTQLASLADRAVTVTPENPRALPAAELADLLEGRGVRALAAGSLREGLEQARKEAGEEGIVLATGSLYFIGSLRSELGLKP